MGKTDVGRILLLADLQKKKDIGKLTDPRASQRAQQFWQEVDKSIPAGTPISFRVWIVPGRVVVNTGGAGTDAYIADAQLHVKREAQYLRERGGPPSGQSASLPQTDASQQAAETLLTREILPDLVNRVNHADQYAELRQIFMSRVMAEVIRQQPGSPLAQQFAGIVNLGSAETWRSTQTRTAQSIWNDYLKSMHEDEYNLASE